MKSMSIIAKRVEDKALEIVMTQARNKARDFLCPECPDKRCRANLPCKTFDLITKSNAWGMIIEKPELN